MSWTTGTIQSADSCGSFVYAGPEEYSVQGRDLAQPTMAERAAAEVPHARLFLEYIDEDCPCPTRRETDMKAVRLAQQIHRGLRDIYDQSIQLHKDMIFRHAQEIIGIVDVARHDVPPHAEGFQDSGTEML